MALDSEEDECATSVRLQTTVGNTPFITVTFEFDPESDTAQMLVASVAIIFGLSFLYL